MVKSLYFKIVLILLIFIIAVMCAVCAILMNSVTSFYVNDFSEQMTECFDSDSLLVMDLKNAVQAESPPVEMKNILSSYGTVLGIDQYRNYYVLDMDGQMLACSDRNTGSTLSMTPNILAAISGADTNIGYGGMDYSDWAVRIPVSEDSTAENYIVYIKDSLDEMRQLNNMLFSIIFQAMFVGVLIAVVLSFFLAKSISAPLQSLTYGTQLVALGEFSHDIEVRSADEIGILAENFNIMREKLRATLEEVDGEREKLDTILSCMKDAVIAFTNDGEKLHSNPSASELFAMESTESPFTVEKYFELLDLPLSVSSGIIGITSPDIEAEVTRDGFIFHDRIFKDRVYDVNFAQIRYIDGGKIANGCILIIHDVTGRYELDESRREFVANVSHELRTPLTSIKGATETVRMDPDMDSEMRDYFLDMVLTESDRMTRIVSDLLTLSRLDNKRTKWNIETFDMKQSIRHLCEVMRSDLESHKHHISFRYEKNLPSITADRQRLEQVIINIFSNAIKYTPEGGKIDIRLTGTMRNDTRYLRIQIADNGIGIPKDDIAHLFERFYRVEKSRTQDAGGTGLGLAIAKEIIEAHSGTIAIDSTLGSGTTVRIELPIECKIKINEKDS